MPEAQPFCSNCSSEIRGKAAFCSNCGSRLFGSEPIVVSSGSILGRHRTGTASWSDLRRLSVFYGLLLGCSLVFGIVHKFHPGPKIDVTFGVTWIAIVVGFLVFEWSKVSRSFNWKMPKSRTLLELACVSLAVVGFLKLYFLVFSFFDWPLTRVSEPFTKAHWPLWSILLIVSVEPGIFEEIAFRGILQTRLAEILSAKEALIIQAALFSVLHLSPAVFVSHFVMGLLLGWVRLRTGHVYFGIVLHMLWNAAVVTKELFDL